jgi:Protein of unknown function (DUF1566)
MRTVMGERGARCGTIVAAVAAWMVLAGGIAPAHAITTPDCLAKKLQAWGNLRQCQRNAEAKLVQGRGADRAACQARFATALDQIHAQAAASAIPCRYRDNGDNTVTDFDTGLMWAKQDALDGFTNVFDILDADNTFTLDFAAAAAASITGTSTTGTSITPVPGIGAHTDWRSPTIIELLTIVDTTTVACQVGGPCIDPIFGLTVPGFYWASTTDDGSTGFLVNFQTGALGVGSPGVAAHARPVRSAF